MFDSSYNETTGAASNLFGEVVGAVGKTIKIHIARNDLLAELSLLVEIVEPKSLLPTLSYLLIEAARDRLILRAASLNNTLQCEVEADVIEPGSVCLPARKLYEIVRQLPAETIIISGDERSTLLKCGASRFKLNAISPDEFPEAPAAAEPFTKIPRDILLKLIQSSLFAAQRNGDSGRYALDTAQLTIGPNGARMIATDGHRLICVERLDITQDKAITLLIPRSSLSAIAKVFSSSEGEVDIGLDLNRLFFGAGARRFSCVLRDGAYPDCEPLLSKSFERQLTLDCQAFKEVVNRMSVFGVDGGNREFGMIKFHFSPDRHELLSVDPTGGEGKEEIIPLSSAVNVETTISFNGRYLQDFARALSGSALTIKYNDENSLVELRPTTDDGYVTRYILMPCLA
ncbi:MAG: DNA polymerase III subunit beta [Blastocatellales bacterium]